VDHCYDWCVLRIVCSVVGIVCQPACQQKEPEMNTREIISSLFALCVVSVATTAMAQESPSNNSETVVDDASKTVHSDTQIANDIVNQITAPPVAQPELIVPSIESQLVVPNQLVVPPGWNSSTVSVPTAVPVQSEPVAQPNYRTEYHPDISSSSPYKLHAGLYSSVGFPGGAEIGLLVSPFLPWLKVGVGGNYNYVGEGLSGHATLDPFKSPVSLTLTFDGGGFFPSSVPNVKSSPVIAYTYEDALLGFEFGSRRHFRFFVRGGVVHIDANVSHFGNAFTLPSGVSIGNPNVSLVSPAGKLGFDWLF